MVSTSEKDGNLLNLPDVAISTILSLCGDQRCGFIPPDFSKAEAQLLQQCEQYQYYSLSSNDSQFEIGCSLETLSGGYDRLNEDAVFVLPLDRSRILFGVVDGVSAQKDIVGLRRMGISGGFFASHLISMGFPESDLLAEIRAEKDVTAEDIMLGINSWLKLHLMEIEGVDYDDPLTIPGAAATLVLIDAHSGIISVAHVADTVLVQESPAFTYQRLTHNLNKQYDDETMAYVEGLAAEHHLSLRQVMDNPELKIEIRRQLQNSFCRKINTSNGCGILNGMDELESNQLIESLEIPLAQSPQRLFLYSDGAMLPYESGNITEDSLAIMQLVSAGTADTADARNLPPKGRLWAGAMMLMGDKDFLRVPRLKMRDDASLIEISIARK